MSTDQVIAAVASLERLRPPPRLPQPANAVFNRLELTEEQQPYWQAVEASLREVVWDRSHGVRQRVDPSTLEQLKQAAAAFRATLSAQQRSKNSRRSPISSDWSLMPSNRMDRSYELFPWATCLD